MPPRTSTDVSTLINARPTGQRAQQVVSAYISVEKPAPATADDPAYVVIPSHNPNGSTALKWPQLHGITLPSQGAAALVLYDEQNAPNLVWWDGAPAWPAPTPPTPPTPPPSLVSVLPNSPVDAQEVYLEVDKAAAYGGPFLWHCRYSSRWADGTPRTTPCWDVLEPNTLRVDGVGGQNWTGSNPTTTSLGYTTIDSLGPSIVVPFSGDYEITGQATTKASVAQNLCGFLFWTAADGTVTWQFGDAVTVPSAAANGGTIFGRRERTLSSGTTVSMLYATSNTSSAAMFYNRGMYLKPIRLSA